MTLLMPSHVRHLQGVKQLSCLAQTRAHFHKGSHVQSKYYCYGSKLFRQDHHRFNGGHKAHTRV